MGNVEEAFTAKLETINLDSTPEVQRILVWATDINGKAK